MHISQLHKCLNLLQKRWGSLYHHQVTNILAYGSAALPQIADSKKAAQNTLDLLIQVRNSQDFHSQLLRHCQEDYAGLPWLLGSSVTSFTNKNIFPMHSNHIMLGDKKVKYSIIGKSYLREDLKTWKYLSFAGRLHKAVIPLQPFSQDFQLDLAQNRQSALAITLLMLRRAQNVHFRELLQRIVQISYSGDIRFSAGAENPKKVQNIVDHSFNQLYSIYHPLFLKIAQGKSDLKMQNNLYFSYQLTPPVLATLLTKIPLEINKKLIEIHGQPLTHKLLMNGVGDLRKDISDYLTKTNRKSSFWMAFANLIIGSPFNNASYLLAKLAKGKRKQ